MIHPTLMQELSRARATERIREAQQFRLGQSKVSSAGPSAVTAFIECTGNGGRKPGREVEDVPGAITETGIGLTDQLIAVCLYREWKHSAAEVSAAYERFANAGPDIGLAFAAYRAALDREEAAALAFASRVALIKETCHRGQRWSVNWSSLSSRADQLEIE